MIIETSLIAVGTWLSTKLADKGFDNILAKISSSAEIDSNFRKAVNKVSKELQLQYPNILGGSIDHFFRNEVVLNELFKLLFRSSKVDEIKISELFDTSTLPKNFIKDFIIQLRKELLKDRLFDEILSNNELFVLFQGVGSDIKNIAESSAITASEIQSISKKLEQRIGDVFVLSNFIDLYRMNALNNLSQINFIGLGIDISIKKNRKNLQDIFVKPVFSIRKDNSTKLKKNLLKLDRGQVITYDDIFEVNSKIVLLGNPGSGKSILVKSIICDILSNDNTRFNGKFLDYFPFRIELRKYLAFKKDNGGNLIKYLVFCLESEYQINNITEPIIHSIILNNKCILFFDGLDEIFDVSDKIDTKNDIENFHNTYLKTVSITTSRIIGYEDASLNDEFSTINIKNFDNEKIKEYVTRWYSKEEEIEEIRERELRDFLKKMHEIDQELLSNPLLLSLIVILYRNILKLPESKLEIYQSCTKTLVDKWDASKNLEFNLGHNLTKQKDKLFADLAFWQYGHLSSKDHTKITYEKAKQTIAESILRLNISDDYECADLAEAFMDYAQKRSIYFDDNFTHKTFLEYYTAYWVYSNIEKKHKVDERNELIIKYVNNPFWYIVLELLFNLIDKDQGDNDIIDEGIKILYNEGQSSFPFLLTVIFKLKNISSDLVELIVLSSISTILDGADTNSAKLRSKDNSIFQGLEMLFHQNTRSKDLIIRILKTIEVKNKLNLKASINLYILYTELESPLRGFGRKFGLSDKPNFEKCCVENQYLFTLNIYIFNFKKGNLLDALEIFISNFGINSLFKEMKSIHANYTVPSYFSGMIGGITSRKLNTFIENISTIHSAGLTYELIVKNLRQIDSIFLSDIKTTEIISELNKYNPKEIDMIIMYILSINYNNELTQKQLNLIKDVDKRKIVKEYLQLKTFKEKTEFMEISL